MSIIHLPSTKTTVSKSPTVSTLIRPPSPSLLIAFFNGAVLPIQAAINAQLARSIGSFPLAGDISYFVGTIVLVSLLLTGKFGRPNWSALPKAPWWAFFGGALGATYVTLNTLSIPKLGLTNTTMAVAFGQMLMSLIIDQFGLFGVMSHIVSAPRLLGTGLLLAAVILIQLDAKHSL